MCVEVNLCEVTIIAGEDMLGQVVVYSIVGCPHCIAAKGKLTEIGIPYIDISVDKFTQVRQWLQEKTGKTSVPQIFFNSTHIGGNKELQDLIKESGEEWEALLADLRENEPTPEDLMIPEPEEEDNSNDSSAPFVCELEPMAAIRDELVNSDILHTHRTSLFSTHKNAFTGEKFIEWICQHKEIESEEAVKIGTELLTKKFIEPIEKQSTTEFYGEPKTYYQLISFDSEKNALNGGPSQNCRVEDPSELAESLRKLILTLYSDHISPDGKSVDYKAMKKSEGFEEYVKLSRELQRAPVESMTQDERKAFFINIYNALVIHANVLNGPATSKLSQLRFFDKTKYILGGRLYSLNEIENGVLRANKRGPTMLFAPFGKSDPRLNVILEKTEPRIHFALNCGAKSCPPIKTFGAENIDSELQVATEAYLELDEALKVDEEAKIVHLSSLLKWYSSDFGNNAEEILRWVLENVTYEEKKEALRRLIDDGSWKIQYLPYDWGHNGSD